MHAKLMTRTADYTPVDFIGEKPGHSYEFLRRRNSVPVETEPVKLEQCIVLISPRK